MMKVFEFTHIYVSSWHCILTIKFLVGFAEEESWLISVRLCRFCSQLCERCTHTLKLEMMSISSTSWDVPACVSLPGMHLCRAKNHLSTVVSCLIKFPVFLRLKQSWWSSAMSWSGALDGFKGFVQKIQQNCASRFFSASIFLWSVLHQCRS